jgi:carbon storage regulator
MLVLSRKVGEKIVVPACGLTITVVAVKGCRVRLGIAAPEDIRVDREEVWQRQLAEDRLEPACS